MASALSVDLRERVVAAIEAEASRREAARRPKVSPASAARWHGTFVQAGRTQAKPMGGDQRSHAIEVQADLIRRTYEAHPELFLHKLRDRLAERGLRAGVSSLSRFFERHGITRKKNSGHTAEQEREDVKTARFSCFERQLDLAPDRLVFMDETATNTKMIRRYGRAPRGERCRVAVPFSHWKTVTVTTGLRTSGLTATALFDGPMTDACFRGYVEEAFVRALKPGDKVVLDNLPVLKVSGIRERISRPQERGCSTCRPIPPTSTRSNSPSQNSRPSCAPRPLARSATSGTLSNVPSDASRQPNAAAISPRKATTHMIQPDWKSL